MPVDGSTVVVPWTGACETVTDYWCAPGDEIIPASVCRWLVPGCVGVGALAGVVLDSFTPAGSSGVYLKADGPPVAVSPMVEWVELCSLSDRVPLCDEVLDAYRAGRDLVIVARD